MKLFIQTIYRMIKLVLTDIDGVWTDGGMYYDEIGNEWKKFNTSDSAGVLFLRLLNIPIGIITGENTEIVKRRAKKLNINELHLGVKNKLQVATDTCKKYNIQMNELAYIGDDINDIQLLESAGLSACPANAPDYVKSHANIVLKKNGGEGVFRDFVEYILKKENLLDKAIKMYLESIPKSQ